MPFIDGIKFNISLIPTTETSNLTKIKTSFTKKYYKYTDKY